MTAPDIVRVIGPGGLCGTIDLTAWPLDGTQAKVLVRLEGAASVLVPIEALVRQDDGSYHMTLNSAVFERRHNTGDESSGLHLVLPVIQEQVDVWTRPVETGRVRIRKIVHDREEIVDPPLLRDEVVVERIQINRIVEGPIAARTEGDTTIIPLLEEVLVVEKRLLLKEELHLIKRQVATHTPQRVKLRREEAVIEHVDPEGDQRDIV
jgi:uncharacterized protein (TIGR02271 family)